MIKLSCRPAVCVILALALAAGGVGCASQRAKPEVEPSVAQSAEAKTAQAVDPHAAEGSEADVEQAADPDAEEGGEPEPLIAQMLRKLTKKPKMPQAPPISGDDWKLILVNDKTPLSEEFTVNLVQFQPPYRVDERIYAPAEKMFAAARQDGISLMVCSAYRGVDSQRRNFNAKVAEWKSYGYSEEQAYANTLQYIAFPGTSEHHTGLAMDIVTPSYTALNSGYDGTAAAKWLRENAHRYGFILRFPSGKEAITGIAFEPWHYRYVGETAAKIIYDEKLCLEEFLDGGYTKKPEK